MACASLSLSCDKGSGLGPGALLFALAVELDARALPAAKAVFLNV
jgi:hypothetical protein